MNELVKNITWQVERTIRLFRDGAVWKSVAKVPFLKELRGKEAIDEATFRVLEKKLCSKYAANLLVKRAYTSSMLAAKLKEKGFEKTAVEQALSTLEKYGYLNDEKRIEAFIEKYAHSGYGPAYIQAKLQMTLKLPYETAYEKCMQYCKGALLQLAIERAVQKTKGKRVALARRGFSYETIQSFLS